MEKKIVSTIAVLTALMLVVQISLVAVPTVVSSPKSAPQYIPVDVDPYYKSLTGGAAFAKIQADTIAMQSILTNAKGGSASGVGDVEYLYADGWREFTLRAIGGNAEIWVANDLSYPPGDPRPADVVTQEQVDYLLEEFNDVIYPDMTTYFGFTDDRDGMDGLFASWGYDWYATDNPQRVMILVYNIIDESYYDPTVPWYVAGFYWADMNNVYADRNIIHIDTWNWLGNLGPTAADPYDVEKTFTHEYEHAIHADHDPDEASWVDEGMADVAPFLLGYGHSQDHLAYYMVYHRTSLTNFQGGLENYGASYLFQLYLLENFGGADFISALVDEPANGIEGIENQLVLFGFTATFNEIYDDWVVANYLDNPLMTGQSGAKLGYEALDIPSDDTWGYSIQWSIKNIYGSNNLGNLPLPRYWGGYKSSTVQYPIGTLLPYTPMYLTYKGFQPQLISAFRGAAISGIAPHDGGYELWGGRGTLLTNTATLSTPIALGADAELTFWTNYAIEEGWDFGFVQVSTDGGSTWTSLANNYTTSEHDPSAIQGVQDNVPGLTGSSGGWVQMTFDLSAYAGQSVLLRFMYITDWATEENGFYVDDIAVTDGSGTLFDDGLEGGSGNWVLEGWERTTGLAINDWSLTFINPIYTKGKFSQFGISYDNIYTDGPYQRDSTTINTQYLYSDFATIILSNHLPEATQFPADYRLLVMKGNAK
jgi:hypothetical protein